MTIEPQFHPKQKEAAASLYKKDGVTEVLYGGAAGSGKTWMGCVFIVTMCLKYPGTRYLIGRLKLKHLKQTTLLTAFDVLKLFKLKEGVHWTYNGQKDELRFVNGSIIFMKELFQYPSDPDFDSLGSLEITSAFIDEVAQITEKAKNIVMSRIRYKVDENGLEPKLFMSCNPSKGWLYSKYYKKAKEGVLEPYKKFIQALPTDNPHIDPNYIENLKKLDKVSRERLLYGHWEYADELAIFDYDAILRFLNRPKDEGENHKYYVSIDVARLGKDSTVIFVLRDDMTIVDFKQMGMSKVDEVVSEINTIKEKYKIHSNHFISVDADGVGGGVVDYLPGCRSIVNNSRPLNDENYFNYKTQLYAKLSDAINNGEMFNNVHFDIETEQKIQQELMVVNRIDVDKDGKVRYTKKEDIKKALGRSPDYSDALAYMMSHFITVTYTENFEIDVIV